MDVSEQHLQILPHKQQHGNDNAIDTRTATSSKPGSITPVFETFNIVLASETTYTIQSCNQTALLLRRHLKPQAGVAYVATKRYYFGVGGGSDAFREAATKLQLRVDVAGVYDDGKSNIRELLKVTRVC
uniref:Uncharacterized protein n=1 Tax=Proboscia inermis TaxID=420281 RepID=A0A7S0CBI4_9STRA|mmetsp:Transcript_37035/g.37352  ORF Transcript_37035/g.37352 Transcript_37035/m.37352 type:complete len:129 (+) Transcript_37035:205-591(+)